MSELNFGDCIGCGLCILGCPAYEETGFDVLTARGRNKALQAGLAASEMVEPIWACTLCGYCDAICPSDVHNVKIVLQLRRELAGTTSEPPESTPAPRPARRSSLRDRESGGGPMPVPRALVLGCTIRERAPHLIPSINEFLRRIGRPSGAPDGAPSAAAALGTPDEGCCGSLEVEAGRAQRQARSQTDLLALVPPRDRQRLARGRVLGELAQQRLQAPQPHARQGVGPRVPGKPSGNIAGPDELPGDRQRQAQGTGEALVLAAQGGFGERNAKLPVGDGAAGEGAFGSAHQPSHGGPRLRVQDGADGSVGAVHLYGLIEGVVPDRGVTGRGCTARRPSQDEAGEEPADRDAHDRFSLVGFPGQLHLL